MADREPSDGWETATWEGLRREQLRRSRRLTVRERLLALEALAETSARLAEAGRLARERPRREAE